MANFLNYFWCHPNQIFSYIFFSKISISHQNGVPKIKKIPFNYTKLILLKYLPIIVFRFAIVSYQKKTSSLIPLNHLILPLIVLQLQNLLIWHDHHLLKEYFLLLYLDEFCYIDVNILILLMYILK